ncbi:hypothetical protein AB1Y20_007550 [Prymnesium parvum]|uniref:PUB domain-containing protein n=1 Tax=Prymnesium parvum TaxID=97485 RepID=A0AB34IVB9_PRYPA
MESVVTLEFHFPSSWAFEGTVDVLWCDRGNEVSYGRLSQGSSMPRDTYEGHTWLVREAISREVVCAVVARRPDAPGRPQLVTIGAHDGSDPLRTAVCALGRAPHELLVQSVPVLSKLLENICRAPHEPKYRTLRLSNPTIRNTLETPGALALLRFSGFEERPECGQLALEAATPLRNLEDSLAQLQRMRALLQGLPPPKESLHSLRTGVDAANASSSTSNGRPDEPSHRCSKCSKGIHNDLRRALAGNGEVGGWRSHDFVGTGEFRYHCGACDQDLCSACYDMYKAGNTRVHPPEHFGSIEIVAPITTPWGGNGYGVPPAPPPYNPRNRRGPWG